MKTFAYGAALWLLCGVIGEMLLERDRFHLDQIAMGPITLGKGITHFVAG